MCNSRSFIKDFCRRATGFHSWTKPFDELLWKKLFTVDGQTRQVTLSFYSKISTGSCILLLYSMA